MLGVPGHAVDIHIVTILETGHHCPVSLLLPPDPDGVITAPSDQEPPLAPVHGVHCPGVMTRQGRRTLPARLPASVLYSLLVTGAETLPDLDAGVFTAASESLPLGIPGDVPDSVGVTGQAGHAHPVVAVLFVHLDGVVVTTAGQDGKDGVPGHRLDILTVRVKDTGTGPPVPADRSKIVVREPGKS